MKKLIETLKNKAIQNITPDFEESLQILNLPPEALPSLLEAASSVRFHYKKNTVSTCAIVNAKSGRCSEDCKYCAQSVHHDCQIAVYPLLSPESIIEKAKNEEVGSVRFGIVTSGKALFDSDLTQIAETIYGFSKNNLKQKPCASLGLLTKNDLQKLQSAGLCRYHCNLETCREYFPQICSTHSYDEKLATINAAKEIGLELCVGGIFGLGETLCQRAQFLYELKEVSPDSIPLNFLVPIKGTRLGHLPQITLWESVKIIALARFLMPEMDVRVCGGRVEVFKDTMDLVFLAGANSIMVGNLLTVKGRSVEDDLTLIAKLCLEVF